MKEEVKMPIESLQPNLCSSSEHSEMSADVRDLLNILSAEPPNTINVIEMIAKSGAHHCSTSFGPSPEMLDKTVDLSNI
jgi:hypothetical protein